MKLNYERNASNLSCSISAGFIKMTSILTLFHGSLQACQQFPVTISSAPFPPESSPYPSLDSLDVDVWTQDLQECLMYTRRHTRSHDHPAHIPTSLGISHSLDTGRR